MQTLKKADYRFYLLLLLALVLILLNAFQIINFEVWGDEGYSIRLAKMTVKGLVAATAVDVHPPLYYLILKAFCTVFGYGEWVLQGVSMIPYILLVLFSIIYLRKEFGYYTAGFFIVFQSLSSIALTYNIELRMYSWAEFFVIVCAFSAYKILSGRTLKTAWCIFVFSGICAAYLHYYALISVAIIYVVLYITLFIRDRKNIYKCIISGAITSIVYLPWLIVLLSTLKRVAGYFCLVEVPTVWDCLYYLVCGKSGIVLLLLFLYSSVTFMIRRFKEKQSANTAVLILICMLTIAGTMAVGIIVSYVFRPVLLGRYLYPCAGLMWLATAICAPAILKNKKLVSLFLTFFIVNGMRVYMKNYNIYHDMKKGTDITLEYFNKNIQENDIVVTSSGGHLMWTVLEYYMPNAKLAAIENTESWINTESTKYIISDTWLTGEFVVDDKQWQNKVMEAGKKYEFIMEGRISRYPVRIYKIVG